MQVVCVCVCVSVLTRVCESELVCDSVHSIAFITVIFLQYARLIMSMQYFFYCLKQNVER